MDEDDKIRRNLVVFSAAVLWIVMTGIEIKPAGSVSIFEFKDEKGLSAKEIWLTLAAIHAYLVLRFLNRPMENENAPSWWKGVKGHFTRAYLVQIQVAFTRVFGDGRLLKPCKPRYPFRLVAVHEAVGPGSQPRLGETLQVADGADFIRDRAQEVEVLNTSAPWHSLVRARMLGFDPRHPGEIRRGLMVEFRCIPYRRFPLMAVHAVWSLTLNSSMGMDRFFPGLIAIAGTTATLYKLGCVLLGTD